MAKKMDFKALLINHGEKFVVGVVVLLAFLALSSASWSRTDHTPEELEQIAKATEDQMSKGDWPEEERIKFEDTPEVDKMVAGIYGGAADSQVFENSVSWNPLLNRKREKRLSPVVFPPEFPEVSVVSFPLALPPESEDDAATEDDTLMADADSTDPEADDESQSELDELRARFGLRDGARPGGASAFGPGAGYEAGTLGSGLGSGGLGSGGVGSEAYAAGGAGGPGFGLGMGDGYEGEDGGYGSGGYGSGGYGSGMMFSGMGEGMMLGATTASKRVRLTVGASVRMVIDLRQQRKAIAEALHISGGRQATQHLVDYIDLHIERQELQSGPDPWGGEWSAVNSEDIGEILEESKMMGVDQDIVSPAVTRKTITMPLPRRAAGVWQPSEASHSRLENFELSAEEKELINQMNSIIAKKAEEAKAILPPERVQKKGFSSFVTDVGDLQLGMMGTSMYQDQGAEGYAQSIYSSIESQMGDQYQLSDQQKTMLDESRATAADRLLLVRFMDFTVERGKTYRYRVRLEMKNPNYDISIDQLAQPELGSQQTIMSDWSEVTDPASIPMDYRYYVAEVDSRAGEVERVTFPIFMENTDAGMPVMGDIKVNVGMPIGGSQKVKYVDLAASKLEDDDVGFTTRDLLCAAGDAGKLSSSDHPDLAAELGRLPRGQKAMPDQILIVDDKGNLQMRATDDQTSQEKLDRRIQSEILDIYKSWDRPEGSATSAFGALGDYEDEGEGGSGGYQMGMSYGNALSGGLGGYGMGGTGTGTDGKRMSSRERARMKRQMGISPRGAGGAGGSGGGYE